MCAARTMCVDELRERNYIFFSETSTWVNLIVFFFSWKIFLWECLCISIFFFIFYFNLFHIINSLSDVDFMESRAAKVREIISLSLSEIIIFRLLKNVFLVLFISTREFLCTLVELMLWLKSARDQMQVRGLLSVQMQRVRGSRTRKNQSSPTPTNYVEFACFS